MQIVAPNEFAEFSYVDAQSLPFRWRMSRARRAIAFRRVAAWRGRHALTVWHCMVAAEVLEDGDDAWIGSACISAWPVLEHYVHAAFWEEWREAARCRATSVQDVRAVRAIVRGYLLQTPVALATVQRVLPFGGPIATMAFEMLSLVPVADDAPGSRCR